MRLAARASLLVIAAALGACSTTTSVTTPVTAPKKSVYYQNDGPPERVPADLSSVPDATPRVEPIHPRANRPYTALGKSYTPMTTDAPFQQRGLASWYGKQFHGNRTSSGEIYDMMEMTAAHPTLPIPSYVRVTEIRSGRSVIVRVNDRGPFKDDRIIDLSYAAATRLGYVNAGTGEVQVERITMAQIASGDWQRGSAGARAPAAASPVAAAPGSAPTGTSADGRWAVQLGAFSQEEAAQSFAQQASSVLPFVDAPQWPAAERSPRIERDQGMFRVLVLVFGGRTAALSLAKDLAQILDRPTVVIAR